MSTWCVAAPACATRVLDWLYLLPVQPTLWPGPPSFLQVRGDFDEGTFLPGVADSLPDTKVVQIGAFKVGLCHGHQVSF